MDLKRSVRPLLQSLLLLLALALLSASPGLSQKRGDDASRASKNGLAEGKIGNAQVTVTYGRPKVKGRKVWGGIVPYGKVWRAGADEATTVTFSSDVKAGGTAVPAGTYSLFLEPSADEWVFILNKNANQWGAFSYDAGQDLTRTGVKPQSASAQEELTISIEGDAIVLHWADMKGALQISG